MQISMDVIKKIVKYGTMATSADNCQPWKFSWDGHKLSLKMDNERSGFFYDINHESTYMTLGAVAENIMIAATHYNLKATITTIPKITNNNEAVIANISFEQFPMDENPLFPHMEKRHINRYPYLKKIIEKNILKKIENCTKSDLSVDIRWITEKKEQQTLQSIIYNADKILFEDKRLHSGLFKWIWTDKKDETRLDGMTLDEIGISFIQKPFFKLLSNWKNMSKLNKLGLSCLPAINSIHLLKSSPTYCLISVNNKNNESYFKAGMALEKLWIKANSLGLAVQPMAGFVFLMNHYFTDSAKKFSPHHKKIISDDTQKLINLLNQTEEIFPAMFLRLGYPSKKNVKSKRRPVKSVLNASC